MFKKLFFETSFRVPITALMFLMSMMTSVGMVSDAQATQAIMTANGAPACTSCHAGGAFSKAEGQAGLVAFLATKVPVCVAPQVLNAAKTACVAPPPPVCVAPKVLNAAKTACVAPPPPVCVAPKVLNAAKTACVAPPPPVCVAPQVLNAAKTACVAPPPPVCVAPQVLNAAKTACVAPPPPVCVAPQVLNAAKTACVAPTPPVCVAPQVLNAAKTACVAPTPPVCVAPQVLNAAKTACVAPTPPVCVAPKVLNAAKTACVVPTPPVCVAPQVLNAAKTACVAPTPPVCVAPKVLNAAKTACVVPTPPVCVAPKVLNAAKTACVSPTPVCKAPQVLNAAKTACVTPAPTACGTTEHDDDGHDDDGHQSSGLPTLTAPDKVSVHAGELLTLAVTAFDCADRSIEIQATGLPEGATIVNSIDPQLHMPKAVISWTPSVNRDDDDVKIVLKAVATDVDNKKTTSAPKTVVIKVLPAVQAPAEDDDHVVKRHVVASAQYVEKSKKLGVAGQVVWEKDSTVQERKALIAAETAVITDAITGAELGTASVGKEGKWRKVIAINPVSAPCSIDVSFHGKAGVKVVKGVSHCKK